MIRLSLAGPHGGARLDPLSYHYVFACVLAAVRNGELLITSDHLPTLMRFARIVSRALALVKERILQIEEYMYRHIVDNFFVSNFVGLALRDSSAYACLSGRVFRFRVLRGTNG